MAGPSAKVKLFILDMASDVALDVPNLSQILEVSLLQCAGRVFFLFLMCVFWPEGMVFGVFGLVVWLLGWFLGLLFV